MRGGPTAARAARLLTMIYQLSAGGGRGAAAYAAPLRQAPAALPATPALLMRRRPSALLPLAASRPSPFSSSCSSCLRASASSASAAAAAAARPSSSFSPSSSRLYASASAASSASAAAAADAARASASAEAEAEAAREAEQARQARSRALAALRAGPPSESDAARSSSEILDAIVKVFTTASRPDQWSPWSNHVRRESTGTAFMIGDGLLLTCAHVVADASYITLRRHGASQRFRAEVVAVGHDVDLALLTVPDEGFWQQPGPMKPLRLAEGVPKLQSRVVEFGWCAFVALARRRFAATARRCCWRRAPD
jgi:S1-C subfamily serine protease